MPDDAPRPETQEPSQAPFRRKKNIVMGGIFLGAMLVEAVVVFGIVKYFTPPPAKVEGSEVGGLKHDEGRQPPKDAEIEVAKVRAQNEKSQRMLVYELTVFASVEAGKQEEDFKELVARRRATIQDRFSSVVRAADPQRFMEPDLATLRRQFQQELSKIVGEDIKILAVLIPSIVCHSGD